MECESQNPSTDVSMVSNTCSIVGNLDHNVSYSQAARGFGGSRNPLYEGEEGEEELDSADDQGYEEGPWMIGESYLTIRRWVPNFIADEAPIKTLTAWVRIPHLSVEYFDKQILHKIGSKIGKVIKIDRNTESMDRGPYVRFCIEVDLSKPLLSKFVLNKRTWIIQYEGLKLICFKCGRLGDREDNCHQFLGKETSTVADKIEVPKKKDEGGSNHSGTYGAWMLVQKPGRKYVPKLNHSSNDNN
ncbi:uncharacterized protein LOC104899471 [Beta vulgaris subsp. vulgaris]|uniref:uncharacterized protein LOC104899471 n=1 Tax=Beta vulgaris subsp. vulgaris TaxID=3555 RepID=UPI00053F8FB4|nr:uncharacterized protein LOC104899471 [Beta vulgaris subsp. vulgaris]